MESKRRVALVSGAGRGIGRAVALELAAAGVDLVLTARTETELDAVAADVERLGSRALVRPYDISDPSAVHRLMEDVDAWQGRLSILINNAGGAHIINDIHDLDPKDFERGLALNLSATHHCMHAAAPLLMRESGGATVVNIVSIAAARGLRGMSYYSAAKAGVVGLSRAAARDWGPHGVRVNCVAPGLDRHDAQQRAEEAAGLLRADHRRHPARALGRTP